MQSYTRKLFIDLGHSKRFAGADGRKFGGKAEVDWIREVWAKLQPKLSRNKWDIVLVPDAYWNDWSGNNNLVHRINWINKNGGPHDWLLSMHGNAAGTAAARGVETCYCGGYESMRALASQLSLAYSEATGVPVRRDGSFDDRTGRFGRIGMVRDTEPLALLVEMGFVTSPKDMAVSAESAAQGIANFFNGKAV